MKKLLLIVSLTAAALIFAACGKNGALAVLPANERTASEAPAPTQSALPVGSAEAAREPSPAPIPADDPYLVLVNFKHPILEEPPVVLVCDYLTASNVYCDPRRHANETAVKALNEMLMAAEQEGDFHFIIASAFRYIWEQQMMWEAKLKSDPDYGKDPYNDPVKLMPGNCSEHITGLAFDILSESCPHSKPGYELTSEAQWLACNAHRFGFILRYPEGKSRITGVQFEPWHFRYVGRAAAEYIHSHSICLEEYLGEG